MHPFEEAYEKFKNFPLDTLKKNNEANVYGDQNSWSKKAVEFIIKEQEDMDQKEKFKKDFELTKQNVEATKEMASQTRSLVIATWGIVLIELLILFFKKS